MASDWDGKERRKQSREYMHIAGLDKRMDRFEVAMFAHDKNNEFGRVGLMTTADRLDSHLDTLCSVAQGVKWIVAVGVPLLSATKLLGWW